jgi:Ca2+-binding RTX toxin-like protein
MTHGRAHIEESQRLRRSRRQKGTTMLSSSLRRLALAASLALSVLALAPVGASAGPPTINPELAKKYIQLFSCSSPTINGTNGPDSLMGTAGADSIRGYDGIDSIQGKGSNDRICGDGGADSGLYGGFGNDIIRGGSGNDHAVSGNEGDDWVFGDAGDDVLGAHPGKDSVYGGADNDTLYGDTWPVDGVADPSDKDYLDGGSGFDTCYPGFEDTVKNCEVVHWPQQPPA